MASKTRVHFNQASQEASNIKENIAHRDYVEKYERQQLMIEQGFTKAKQLDEWLKNNPDVLPSRVSYHVNSIAVARFNKIDDVVTNSQNSVFLLNHNKIETKSKYQAPKNAVETYNRLGHDFYDYVRDVAKNGLVKNQTGTDLIKNTINLNGSMLYQYTQKGVSIPFNQLVEAGDNIWNKGSFMAYDLETLGGVDHTGQQVLDAITEFSFGEAGTTTGKVGKYYGSIIGITPEQHREFTNIIHRYESGAEMSNRDQVIMKRLAKTGNSKTNYAPITGKQGLFEYTSFASDVDVKAMSTKDMRAGVDSLLDIYRRQQGSTVEYNNQKMYAWEQQLLKGLGTIKNKDLTAVGHNSGSFDLPLLNRFLRSGRLSKGAQSALAEMGLQSIDLANRHYDTLAALRSGRGNNWIDMFNDDDREMMKERGLTHFQLESLTRKYDPSYYEDKVAHVGKTDIGANASMLVKSGLFRDGEPNYLLAGGKHAPQALTGGDSMLFYAQESMGMDYDRGGSLSFVADAMTGETRTFSGMKIGADGIAEKELFGQYGFQRGVSYTLSDIYEHEMTDEWGNVIRGTHPALDNNRIVTATFNPVTDSDSFKSNSPVTIVGTREEVQQKIDQHLLLTGQKQDGQWQVTDDKDVRRLMSEVEYDPATGKQKNIPFTIERQLEESTLRTENEAAARARREMSIKKETGLLTFFEDMDAYVANNASATATAQDVEAARKRFHEIARQKSLNVARGVTDNSLNEAGSDMVKSYHEYFGWQDKNSKKWRVYRETVDAALNSENYSQSVRESMKLIVDAAKTRGGKDETLQDFYFKQYYTGLQAYAAQSKGIDAVTNTQPLRVREADRHKFDIDLLDYVNRDEVRTPSNFEDTSHILTLNLDTANGGLADRLLKKRGFTGTASEADQIKEIKNFTDHLISNGIISKKHGSIDVEKETLETATQHMLSGLRKVRNTNKKAGRILDSKFQNVTIASTAENFGFSPNEVKNVIDKINKTMPRVHVMDKNTISEEANRIVENVLFDKVSADDLLKAGYSQNQADDLMKMRSIRMNDTKKFMSDFMQGLSNTDAHLLYDEENRNIHLFSNGIQTQLNNLPRDIYQDGRFYTQIGNMKVVAPIGAYSSNRGTNKLEFKSLIGKAHDSIYWMNSAFQRGVDENDVAGQANNIVGAFAKVLRKSSSVMKGDMQDSRANGYFSMGDVIPELQNLYKKGVFNGINFEEHDEFISMLKNSRQLNLEHLSYKPRTLITINAKTILNAIAKQSGDGFFEHFAEKFSWDNKNPTNFVGTVDNKANFGDVYGASKRGHIQQVSRAKRFNADKVKQAIDDKALKGIAIGRSLHTSTELIGAKRRLDGLSYATDSAVRVTRMAMRTKDLRSLVVAAHGQTTKYVEDMLSGIHLDEGSAVASPELLDEVFSTRSSTQKIMLQKIVEHNNSVIEELKTKRNTAPKLVINADGKITFEYSNGVFVYRGEDLLSINGYKGSTSETLAKESGMLRFGVFSKTEGLLATQESIQDILNSKQNLAKIGESVDPIQEVLRILNQKYDLGYYVESFDANPHRKMAEAGVEKNMTHFLAGGLGTSADPKVAKTLKALGLGSMLYQVPRKEYIDALSSNNISNTALGSLISKQGQSATHDEITGVIQKNYGTVEGFQKALYEERNAPMQALRKILTDNGLANKDESIHFVSDNFMAEEKHKDPSATIRRVVDQLMYEYEGDANKVHAALNDSIKGLRVENGELIAPNGNIDITELQRVIANEKLNEKVSRTGTNGIKADVANTTIVAMDDHDRGNYLVKGDRYGKGLKFTDRNLQMLEWERYGEAGLDRVRSALDKATFDRAFGHVLESDGSIKKDYKGRALTASIGDQIRRAMYASPGDKLLTTNGHVDNVVKKHLENDGVDVAGMLKSIGKEGIANVSAKALEDHYSVATGLLARDWNTGRGHNDLAAMTEESGFEVKTLGRLVSTPGGNKDVADSIYGKKIMLDLHMDELGKNQLYSNEQDRYVALPYEPKAWIDKQRTQEAKTPFQQKVSTLQNMAKQYITSKDGGVTEEEQAKLLSNMRNAVTGIKEAVSTSVTAKKQGLAALAETRLDDAGLFKAHGIQLFGNETSDYYKALEFDGKNLVKEAARGTEGAEYDATFVGREFIQNVYNDKYLNDLGISQDEIVEHIKSKGTLSINVREPADYMKSSSVSNLYLSDAVTGNMALSTSVQFNSKKGDYDGDSMGVKVLKGEAYIQDKNGKEVLRDIDYAAYQVLQKKNVNVRLTDDTKAIFADAIAAMHYNAADYNKAYRVNKEKDDEVNRNSMNLGAAKQYAIDNTLRPLDQKYDEKKLQEMQLMYDEISNGLSANGQKYSNINDLRTDGAEFIAQNKSAEKESYLEALQYGISKEINKVDSVAKQRRAAAGEVNHYLYQHRRLVDIISDQAGSDILPDERDAIQKVAQAVQEGFLSPKNESNINANMLEEFKSAMSGMMGLNGEADGTAMKEFLMKNIRGRSEMKHLPGDMTDEKAMDIFSLFGSRVKLSGIERAYFAQGILTNGIATDKAVYYTGNNYDSMDRSLGIADNYLRSTGVNSPVVKTNLAEAREALDTQKAYSSATKALNNEESEGMITLLGEMKKKMASVNVTGKSLAFGAVGLAGAVMLAGFVGGNPSKPAETQAQDDAEDEYRIPQLTDTNLNNTRGGPNQGYVININAQTKQGQQHASNAVHQALSKGFNNTNINVAMNVQNSGEANSAQVMEMLKTAFA